jgi:Xaa-Pro dipeptidase
VGTDVGRTYVVGEDPIKHRLVADLPRIWHHGKAYFDEHPDVTGAELFEHVLGLIDAAGWGHVGRHSGHLVGEFPHEKISGSDIDCYITTGNDDPMRRDDPAGNRCHWILEIHLVDPARRFGGFFEQLLDV